MSNDDQIDLHQLIASDALVSDYDISLPDKETILQRAGIDENLKSSKMVVMAPNDQDSSEFKELTSMVEGTVTPGEIIKIDPTKAVKKDSRTPLAWLLALLVTFFLGIFQRTLRHETEYWWHSSETVTRCYSQGFAGRELGH